MNKNGKISIFSLGLSFLLISLLQLSVELGHDEDTVNRYYRHLFQDLLEDMEDLAVRLSVQSLPFAFDSFIEPLKEDSLLFAGVRFFH